MESKEKKKRELKRILEEKGSVSHEELSLRLGLDWDDTREIVKSVKREGGLKVEFNDVYTSN